MWPWSKIHELEYKIDAYERMRSEMADARWWLDGEATDTLDWALNNYHNRGRAIGEPAVGNLPSTIGDFRDYIERKYREPADKEKRGAN